MKKFLIGLTVLLFFAVAISPALAQRGRGMRPREGPCTNLTAIKGLDLTAEQTAKIRAFRKTHLKDTKPLKDELFSKRGDLRMLWLEKNPEPAKIAAKRNEIGSLRDQMQDKKDAYRLQVYNILTSEQREKVEMFLSHSGPSTKHMRHGKGDFCLEGGPGMGMSGNW